MSEAFVGELRQFAFGFAPRNWALCQGQLVNISQNNALFALLGTTYGGNGTTTFALPDLRGRVAIDDGQSPGLSFYANGQVGGTATHTLLLNQLPQHNHFMQARAAQATLVGGALPASTKSLAQAVTATNPVRDVNLYGTVAGTPMRADAIALAGGSQPHENRQPYLVINWCICTVGIFPSRN